MAYDNLRALAIAVGQPGVSVMQAGLREFSPWTLLGIALAHPEVTRSVAAALPEVASALDEIALAAEIGQQGDWDEQWASENLGIAAIKGLLLRMAADFGAIECLLPNHPRQAAALARGVYEAGAWIDLIFNAPRAVELYRHYHERDAELADRPVVAERQALYAALIAERTAGVTELRPHQLLKESEAQLAEIDTSFAALRARLIALAPTLNRPVGKKPQDHPMTLRSARKALATEPSCPYEDFFHGYLFRPTCRIVHASDAFDYYDPAADKIQRNPSRLLGRPEDPMAIVAATVVFACVVADEVAEYLLQFSPDEEPCQEEVRVLRDMRGMLQVLKAALPDVSPK